MKELHEFLTDSGKIEYKNYIIDDDEIFPEDVIRKVSKQIKWNYLYIDYYLSINSIREFIYNIDLRSIVSGRSDLPEEFIEEFFDELEKINMLDVVLMKNKLSENFIERIFDKLTNYNKAFLYNYQKLSEEFIIKHNIQNSNNILKYQKLSEKFILDNQLYIYPNTIKYQKLSEQIIEKCLEVEDLNIYQLLLYQEIPSNLLDVFLNHHFVKCSFFRKLIDTNTNYFSKKQKLALIPKCYQIENDYIIAYKGIRKDRYSEYNFQYQYLPNETYECHCNCNLDEKNSFGLSAWTYKEAQKHSDIVIKVKIHIDDLGAVIHDGNKLRCKKFTVLT